jgi:hypothetical protein
MGLRAMTACAFGAVVGLMTSYASAGFVVPVSADASVNAANPNGVLGSFKDNGGLFVGLDQTWSDYSFYLKFVLPETDEPIASAKLRGFYTSDLAFVPTYVGARLVTDDSWQETTITAATGPTAAGDTIAGETFSGEPGRYFEWDLTPTVRTEAAGDGVLTLLFTTIDGRFGDMKFFASREYASAIDAETSFRLTIDTAPVSAVPLPPAYLGAIGCVAIPVVRRAWRRVVG